MIEEHMANRINDEIKIFGFWYSCPNCNMQVSHSSSGYVCYDEVITCPKCNRDLRVVGLKDEPEVIVVVL